MKFLQGELDIPEHMWPLVAGLREESYTLRTAEKHDISDLYVVEISSLKELSIGPLKVQLNYFKRIFSDFYQDVDRVRTLFQLAQKETPEDIGAWLDANWSSTPDQIEDSKLLRNLRLKFASVDSMMADMETLRGTLPEVLFTTHVDAVLPDGSPLRTRRTCIETVKMAASRIGAHVYDPSDLMREFGQTNAIEDHSSSLAHFTEGFSRLVLDAWYEDAVQDLIERHLLTNPGEAIPRIFVPHARAYLRTRDPIRVADVALLLEVAESYFPEDIHLPMLRLELSIAQDGDLGPATWQTFLTVVTKTPLADLPKLRDTMSALTDVLPEWLDRLSDVPDISADNLTWLGSLARHMHLTDQAAALDARRHAMKSVASA